ncbi:MAG: CHAT domain-containing protein, partial [Kovacikia sp.]
GNIISGRIFIDSFASNGNTGNGGTVALTAANGSITTSSIFTDSSATNGNSGNGGAVSLSVTNGSITTGDIDAYTDSTNDLSNGANGKGGAVSLTAPNGEITTGDINTSAINSTKISGSATETVYRAIVGNSGNGGAVSLAASGSITTGSVDTSSSGNGGTVDITAGRFFRATNTIPFALNAFSNPSIFAGGALEGGAIAIRLSGNAPFVVGDAAQNGTAGAIVTGRSLNNLGEFITTVSPNQIAPLRSFSSSFTQGDPPAQIKIIIPQLTSQILTSQITTDFQSSPRVNFVTPPVAPPTSTISLASDFTDTEEKLTDQFTAHLDLPNQPQIVSVPEAQGMLQKVAEATGIKPAIIYINFASPRVNTNSQTSAKMLASPDNDQLEVLLVTAKGKPVLYPIPDATRAIVLKTAEEFRYEVADPSKTRTQSYLPFAQQLYRWLIAPLKADLDAQGIQTLAFVMDSGLRFLPLAALHDGQKFLVETYSLGLLPTLSLTDTRYGDIKTAQVLAAGASTFANQNPLPAVPIELSSIQSDRWQGQQLFNETFTLANLKQERQQRPFGIIHLATHGEFLPGKLSESYIQLWDTRLRLDQLRSLGWNDPPVELVVLSACRMALGDINAELGFAGFAVQAGAKSALASLWNVSDEGTSALMSEFYRQLQQQPIKAAALRETQLEMLNQKVRLRNGNLIWTNRQVKLPSELIDNGNEVLSHPYFWSAFTLIGSPW